MNTQLFNAYYRNSHLEEASQITVDELNFQAHRPDELEPINKVPNPPGTFSQPNRINN